MSTPTPSSSRRQRLLLSGLIVLMIVMIIAGLVSWRRSLADDAAAAPASIQAPTPPAPPAQPPVDPGPSNPGPSDTPPADPAPVDPAPVDPAPTDEPSESLRPVGPDDQAMAKDALAKAVAAWGQIDITATGLPGSWLSTVRGTGAVTTNFVAKSNEQFYTLWGGAIQMDVNVTGSRITQERMLWTTGSTSLWRVTLQRSLINNTDPTALRTTDKVTWDLLVEQPRTGSFSVDTFSAPLQRNTSPKTYFPGE